MSMRMIIILKAESNKAAILPKPGTSRSAELPVRGGSFAMPHSLSHSFHYAVRRAVSLLVGLGLIWPVAAGAQTKLQFSEVFENLTWRPTEFAESLVTAPLVNDVHAAIAGLPARLPNLSLRAIERKNGDNLRIGSKQAPVAGARWWRHFEGQRQIWMDALEFDDAQAANAVYAKRSQPHSGFVSPDYFVFISYRESEADSPDAVGAIVRHDRYLFNIGFTLPFDAREARGGDAAKLEYLNDTVNEFVRVLETVMRQVVDPAALVGVPSGPVTEADRRTRRLAAFARLWSEVKYNFVFLGQRPELNWDDVLEKYMAHVAAAKSQDEYLRILAEALALLRDGHTSLTGGGFGDLPALHIEPVGGKPVVTAVGNVAELRASGLAPGMELVAIDGRPVEEVLKRDIYPVVSASTPQSRDAIAFYRALEGEPNTKVLATFLDLNGARRTYELTRDSTRHQDAFPSRPLMEFRELPGGIAYVALNSFGNDKLAARFDGYWEQILNSKGLILDVRHNQGGSSENGFAVVARLISQPAPTSTSRTRCYKPTERARGKAEEWYEYPPEKIEPRGEKPYMGTVAVLVGDDTFSAAEDFLVPLKATKRATLIGSPSAGSTGQPLVFGLYGTNVRICTKWDRFPDGTEFVGVGVQPDILVEPTRQDIAQGKDPVLERAIAFIQAR